LPAKGSNINILLSKIWRKTMNHTKYKPYPIVKNLSREWPNRQITHAPIYCSVDLRDGNQALQNPLGVEQKIEYFKTLVGMGFKHIEISYPSASDTDFEFTRRIIEESIAPKDVWLQVLIPARRELIERSVEAMRGAKRAIFHLYNPTSEFQRKNVFAKSDEEIIAMAVDGAMALKELTADFEGEVMFEYTPESFSQTDLEFATRICNAVIDEIKPTKERKMIINLANTMEACTPNIYADRVEWMCKNLKDRKNLIVSVHPHNDRGTAVASAEMAILAGADRVEGTLFGNGERAGNVDLVTLAFNIYSQGIDPRLSLSHIDEVKEFVERITGIDTHIRHPYAGEMIFTAFSGGHQDAIKKGLDKHRADNGVHWEVPYLPIDPKDIKRGYEKVVRINSQSGKGGAAFIIKEALGVEMSKEEQIGFGKTVKKASDAAKKELDKDEVIKLYASFKESNSWNPDIYKAHASFVSDLAMPVVDLLAPKEREYILDLGCGDGTLALEIQKRGAIVKGVDMSANMVEKAKAKGIDANIADIMQLSFEDEFDGVFSNAVLHWIKQSDQAVKNIHKALKQGGRFVAEFGGYKNAENIVDAMQKSFEDNPDFGKFNNPWYFPSDAEYKSLLEENGFDVEYIGLIPRPTRMDDMNNWLDIFANGITSSLTNEQKEVFKQEVCTILKPKLFSTQDGWHLDYVRLRLRAIKK
jgi:2-isopropylmalate synthase